MNQQSGRPFWSNLFGAPPDSQSQPAQLAGTAEVSVQSANGRAVHAATAVAAPEHVQTAIKGKENAIYREMVKQHRALPARGTADPAAVMARFDGSAVAGADHLMRWRSPLLLAKSLRDAMSTADAVYGGFTIARDHSLCGYVYVGARLMSALRELDVFVNGRLVHELDRSTYEDENDGTWEALFEVKLPANLILPVHVEVCLANRIVAAADVDCVDDPSPESIEADFAGFENSALVIRARDYNAPGSCVPIDVAFDGKSQRRITFGNIGIEGIADNRSLVRVPRLAHDQDVQVRIMLPHTQHLIDSGEFTLRVAGNTAFCWHVSKDSEASETIFTVLAVEGTKEQAVRVCVIGAKGHERWHGWVNADAEDGPDFAPGTGHNSARFSTQGLSTRRRRVRFKVLAENGEMVITEPVSF